MVPLAQRHLAVITFEVTLLDESARSRSRPSCSTGRTARTTVESWTSRGEGVDPRKADRFDRRVLEPVLHTADADERPAGPLGYRAAQSGMTIGVVADHQLRDDVAVLDAASHAEDDLAKVIYRIAAEPGVPIRLTKLVSYHTAASVPPRELIDRCERTLDRTHEQGVEHQYADQRRWLDDFWAPLRRRDRRPSGAPAGGALEPVPARQASARAEGQGIAAKGVTGSGYGGHYFWDTEIYVMPFLTYTMPWAARNALRFRYSLLDSARRRAHELSQRGALFPWRTINGEEASAYYAAGTAQYHIDADIAYALSQYVGATGDHDFLSPRERSTSSSRPLDCGPTSASGATRTTADLPHPRRHRAGRVHDRRQRQPLHERARALQPAPGGARRCGSSSVSDPAAYADMVRRTGLEPGRAGASGPRAPRAMSIPYDELPRRSTRRTRTSSSARCGTSRTRRWRSGRCCCTTTRW